MWGSAMECQGCDLKDKSGCLLCHLKREKLRDLKRAERAETEVLKRWLQPEFQW